MNTQKQTSQELTKRFLVAGAGGFLGGHILEGFLARGLPAAGADLRGARRPDGVDGGVPWFDIDLFDAASLDRALAGQDVVVNATGLFDITAPPAALHRVNAAGAQNLARAACRAGVRRFVHLSTVGVYGWPRRIPCDEHSPKRPANPYELSKWLGEKAVMKVAGSEGLPAVVLRPTLVYGPRSRYGISMLVGTVALHGRIRRWGFPHLLANRLVHFVHARDVARAAHLAATHPDAPGKILNVADPRPILASELLAGIVRGLGGKRGFALPGPAGYFANALVALLPEWFLLAPLNAHIDRVWRVIVRRDSLAAALTPRLDKDWLVYLLADRHYSTAALSALGMVWEYPSFEDGIAQTIEWYREKRWIPLRGRT